MAKYLFGNDAYSIITSLPSTDSPRIQTNCEHELLQFMREIDDAVMRRSQQWEKRVSDLQEMLQRKEQELDSLRKELKQTKQELARMQKCSRQKHSSSKSPKHEEINAQEVQKLKDMTHSLEKELRKLKLVVEVKEQQQKQAEASHNHLIQIICELQKSLLAKNNAKAEFPDSAQNPSLETPTSIINKEAELEKMLEKATVEFLAQENVHKEELQAKIMDAIEKTKLNLKNIDIVDT